VNIHFHRLVGLVVGFLVCGLLISGCGDDDPSAPGKGQAGGDTWRFLFQGEALDAKAGMSRPVILDLTAVEGAVSGSIQIRTGNPVETGEFPLSGSIENGQLDLSDGLTPQTGVDFALVGILAPDSTLTATLSSVRYGYQAALSCGSPVPELTAIETRRVDLAELGSALVHVGQGVLFSSFRTGYLDLDADLAVTDTIYVYMYPDVMWQSNTLAYDGDIFYGSYLIGHGSGQEYYNTSDVVEFDSDGQLLRRVPLGHFVNGLCRRDGFLWSANHRDGLLRKLDADGAVVDSVSFSLPNLTGLTWGGDHFWGQSYYLPLVYRLDTAGRLDGFVRLQAWPSGAVPGGLSWADERLLVGRGNLSGGTRLVEIEVGVD